MARKRQSPARKCDLTENPGIWPYAHRCHAIAVVIMRLPDDTKFICVSHARQIRLLGFDGVEPELEPMSRIPSKEEVLDVLLGPLPPFVSLQCSEEAHDACQQFYPNDRECTCDCGHELSAVDDFEEED